MCVLPFLFILFFFGCPIFVWKTSKIKKGNCMLMIYWFLWLLWLGRTIQKIFFPLGYWNKHVFLLFIWIHWIRSLLGCQKLYSYIVVYHLQVMTHWVLSEPLFPPIGYHKIKTFDDFSFQRKSCWFCIYYNVFEVESYCPNLSTFIAWDESTYIVRGAHS